MSAEAVQWGSFLLALLALGGGARLAGLTGHGFILDLFVYSVAAAAAYLAATAAREAYTTGRVPSLPSFGGGGYLCDTCKYDDARYCTRRERPNATVCPDHREVGS